MMQWRITMVNHSQHTIKKMIRHISAVVNITADSGLCLALGPTLQHLQPTMCFIGTLMGTTNI